MKNRRRYGEIFRLAATLVSEERFMCPAIQYATYDFMWGEDGKDQFLVAARLIRILARYCGEPLFGADQPSRNLPKSYTAPGTEARVSLLNKLADLYGGAAVTRFEAEDDAELTPPQAVTSGPVEALNKSGSAPLE